MSDSKIQRAKKQCEKLKEMADEYWEMFEDYHKMELELERVKEIRIQLRGEKDKQWEQKKQAQEELERVKEQNKEHDDRWEELGGILGCDDCYLHHAEQLKELLNAYKSDRDTEHIRYINAMEEMSDTMWEVGQAVGIDYDGRNKDILDAIKKIKEEHKKFDEIWKTEGITEQDIIDMKRQISNQCDLIKELKEENKELRNTIEELCLGTKLKQKE